MYCHTPHHPSFARRNRLVSTVRAWDLILAESQIYDYDTARADAIYARDRCGRAWGGGEVDFFREALDGYSVSGYLEGFDRLVRVRDIQTWLDLIPLIEEMREAKIPGLERIRVPRVALDLQREADEASQREARDRDELEDLERGDGSVAEDLRQCWGTPQDLFDVLHSEYRFTIDSCASPFNCKLDRYWTRADDALSQDWSGERVWCNPPYRDIPAWLAHAHEADLTVYLLPVRSDREWWRRYKPIAECHYFVGESPHCRVRFVAPPGVKPTSNPGIHCLLIFGAGATPGTEAWRSGRTGERL